MDFLSIIEALEGRSYNFRLLQRFLKHKKMPSAQGWEHLKEKYKSIDSDDATKSEWFALFEEIYRNHILYGEKAVAIFDLDEETILTLIEKFSEVDCTSSPFSKEDFLPLKKEKLNLEENDTYYPTWFVSEINSERLIFCSKLIIETRDSFEYKTFTSSFEKELYSNNKVKNALKNDGSIEKIVIIRSKSIQLFDSILIRPEDKRVELLIDFPDAISEKEILHAIERHLSFINKMLGFEKIKLQNLSNLYPCIAKLYAEPDGRVFQANHSTDTKSIKQERMREKGEDLRYELFHSAGLKAVNQATNFFAIAKSWNSHCELSGNPSISLSVHISKLHQLDIPVPYGIINDCNCKEDFEMIISKLIAHLDYE